MDVYLGDSSYADEPRCSTNSRHVCSTNSRHVYIHDSSVDGSVINVEN